MNLTRRNTRPLPSGVYVTQLHPPRKAPPVSTDDHITDPVIPLNATPRNTIAIPAPPKFEREDVFNEIIHALGILAATMRRTNYLDVAGVDLAAAHVKSMADAEQ